MSDALISLSAMLPASTLRRPALLVAVASDDPVRHADLAARIALAGHDLSETLATADVVLADDQAELTGDLPSLRLAAREDEGALPASLTPAQLDAALRAVAVGLRVSLPMPPGLEAAAPAPRLLTPRELEILACLGEGLSNKEIARKLRISAHTVKFHLEAVFAKLGATSRAEAVAKGLRRGLILL